MIWIEAVLVAVDQLGNAIAGGNPDATISSRVGYFSMQEKCPFKWYWKMLERIINFTFYPIDGAGHCQQAYEDEKDEIFQRGSDLARAVLGIGIIVTCLFLAVIIRLAVLIVPSWRHKSLQQ